jgi:hypothetical protein
MLLLRWRRIRSLMTEPNLTTEQLAKRWGVKPGAIKHQRERGIGPEYVTLPRIGLPAGTPRVRYPLANVLAFEEANNITPLN